MALRALLLAPPGAGKGTQGEQLSDRFGAPHIATGDLLRYHVHQQTDLGLQAKAHMDAGGLVPDDLVIELVHDRIAGGAGPLKSFILDGFPRTLPQAEGAFQWGKLHAMTFHGVVSLEVPEEELVRRLVERGELSGRSDDTEAVIRQRLVVYAEQTEPLMSFYEARGILLRLDGTGSVEDVTRRIVEAVAPLTGA